MKELLQKKTVKIGIAVIILAVAVGIISINVRSAQRQREYDSHVDAAEKYLTELDYEQAIAEYTLALEIEPNNEEVLNALEQTYLDYAQSLADAGEYEKAVSVLEEGYAQTGRESLQEKIEDVRNQQAQKEAEEQARLEEEERIRKEEEKKKEELIELVESTEFYYTEWRNMENMLYKTYLSPYLSGIGNSVSYLTNMQMEKLCRQYLDILEPYKEYFGEDWYNHPYDSPVDWRLLSELYFAVGEYELCTDIRNQLYEVTGNDEYFGRKYIVETSENTNEYEYDEYGRIIYERRISTDGSYVAEKTYEYGDYNRPVKIMEQVKHARGFDERETVWEYDNEGRTLEIRDFQHNTITTEQIESTNEITLMYTYTESGFTENVKIEDWHSSLGTSVQGYAQDYEIDEYGDEERVGEAYDKYREPYSGS